MGGYQMLVRGDVMRGKYRNSLAIDSVAFNTTDSKKIKKHKFSFVPPQPFEANVPTKVKIRLTDVAHTFMPGHKMMIQVQSSWFPLVDRNPQRFCNIYECEDSDFQPCTVNIHHSEKNPSRIWLPIIE
jgi:predicted acyl esterase